VNLKKLDSLCVHPKSKSSEEAGAAISLSPDSSNFLTGDSARTSI
jgi:hypothetical protein